MRAQKKPKGLTITKRQQKRFFEGARYFLRGDLGWEGHQLALGFVLALGAEEGEAVTKAQELLRSYSIQLRALSTKERAKEANGVAKSNGAVVVHKGRALAPVDAPAPPAKRSRR